LGKTPIGTGAVLSVQPSVQRFRTLISSTEKFHKADRFLHPPLPSLVKPQHIAQQATDETSKEDRGHRYEAQQHQHHLGQSGCLLVSGIAGDCWCKR